MEFEEFCNEINEKAKKLNINFEMSDINQFFSYMNSLIMWNEKINLTAIIEPKEIIIKHFIDSLTISKYLNDGDKVLDVGTEAGFPRHTFKNCKKKN